MGKILEAIVLFFWVFFAKTNTLLLNVQSHPTWYWYYCTKSKEFEEKNQQDSGLRLRGYHNSVWGQKKNLVKRNFCSTNLCQMKHLVQINIIPKNVAPKKF